MFLGIDIGTSGVKATLIEDAERIHASVTRPIHVDRPHPHWSEQHPDLWWREVVACLDQLAAEEVSAMASVRGLGLSGQMLGTVLLDKEDRPLRSCILWNDGRAVEECRDLLEADPEHGKRVGCNPNPGYMAPKLLWLSRHEPEIFSQIDGVLAPKDYINLKLTGRRVTEPTDACGSQLMDVVTGTWAQDRCDAVGLSIDVLPEVVQACDVVETIKPDLAGRWGLRPSIVVAGGMGDNMAGSIGVGVATPGQAVISIGTSGVISVVDAEYHPMPTSAVMTHQHAMPGTFLSMGVVLSATSCLDWAAEMIGLQASELAGLAERVSKEDRIDQAPIFLPYVNGLRSPHDLPQARGLMMGLDLSTDHAALGWAVMEGIAFHFHDALNAQLDAGIVLDEALLVGGGARSALWAEMIATLLDMPLGLPVGREVSAAIGATRLARVAAGEGSPEEILAARPVIERIVEPNAELASPLLKRFEQFEDLFQRTRQVL
ncbi:MAG: xylulokinase [Pseudomonadota bacterium]